METRIWMARPEPLIYPDVHSISVHARSADLVLAPTGGGFYRSTDGGETWALLYDCYCRAVWVDPIDPQHMILGPADGVDRNGRIEMTTDGGRTWLPASAGLKVPWRNSMVERFTQVDDDLLAVLSNGELFSARSQPSNGGGFCPRCRASPPLLRTQKKFRVSAPPTRPLVGQAV